MRACHSEEPQATEESCPAFVVGARFLAALGMTVSYCICSNAARPSCTRSRHYIAARLNEGMLEDALYSEPLPDFFLQDA
jgi:hypothetical protein